MLIYHVNTPERGVLAGVFHNGKVCGYYYRIRFAAPVRPSPTIHLFQNQEHTKIDS